MIGRAGSAVAIAAVAGMLVAGAVLTPVGRGRRTELALAGRRLPPTCWFRTTTGLPCAGCGLTRSVVYLLHGRPIESSQQHPLGVAVVALAVFQIPPRLAGLLGREGEWSRKWDRLWCIALLTVVALLVALWPLRLWAVLLGA